jgi:hypothetical protein
LAHDDQVEPFFIGPGGRRITLAQLPSSGRKPLSTRCRALVVAAVRHGLITLDQACNRYALSTEEYLSWHVSFAKKCVSASTEGATPRGRGGRRDTLNGLLHLFC